MGKGGKGKKGGKQDSAGIEPSAVEHAQLSSREKEKTERRTVSLSEAKRLIAAAQARVQGKTSLLDSNLERMQALFKEMQRVRKNPKDLEEKFLELEGELKTIEEEEIRLENEASTIVRPDQSGNEFGISDGF